MNLSEVRDKYPQYKDVPDDKLVNGLYDKFYAGKISRDEFDKKVGYTPAPAVDNNIESMTQRLRTNIPELGKSVAKLAPNILTGIAQGTYDLGSLIPGFDKIVPAPQSVNEIIGLGEQSNLDKGVSKFASFLPTMLGAEAAIPAKLMQGLPVATQLLGQAAKQGFEGGIYSQSVDEDPLTGIALGAAMPLGQSGFNKAADLVMENIVNPTRKSIMNNVAPKVLEREFSMGVAPETVMQKGEDMFRKKHDFEMDSYRTYRKEGEDIAKKLDTQLSKQRMKLEDGSWVESKTEGGFDANNYVQSLNKIKASKNPKYEDQAKEIEQIDQLIEKAPTNYEDATILRKYINKELDLNDISHAARQGLISSVESTVKKSDDPLAKDFFKTWQKANSQYAEKVVPFYQIPNKKDVLKFDNDMKKTLQRGGDAQGNLMEGFGSKGARVDTLGIDYLAKLLGSKEMAGDIVRASHFKKDFFQTPQGESPRNSYLTKYQQLSPAQQNAMFRPKEKELLDVLLSNKNQFLLDNGTIKGGSKDVLKGAAIGGLAGEVLGSLVGLPLGSVGASMGAIGGKNMFDLITNRYATGDKYLQLSKKVQASEKAKNK